MDNNWIFDGSSQASTATMNNNNNAHATPPPTTTNGANTTNGGSNYTPSQTNAFLNFDSPSNQSDSQHTTNAAATSATNFTNLNSGNHLDYLDPTSHLKKDEWTQISDFSDIDMNFFHNDSNAQVTEDNDHQILTDPTINENDVSGNHASIPPTPQSSFDVDHYTNSINSSFIQNFDSPQLEQNNSSNSIRPEMVFTPLVSPAVTPLESMINKNNNNQNVNGSNNNGNNFFSPLTSPALEAKSPMKFRKSSTSSPQDDNNNTTTKKKYKRKTPGNTPIVGPTIPGRIAKQSPIIKVKRTSSYATSIQQHHNNSHQEYNEMTPLPDPSVDSTQMAPPSSKPSSSGTPTSLPRRRSSIKRDSSSTTPTTTTATGQIATPATLMNFKLDSQHHQPLTSPVILPSNDHPQPTQSRRPSEDSDTKKTSHKLAEQGRRNRMNQAIIELGELIPEELQQTVSIPSKATTVELATRYIRELQGEVRRLREGIGADSDESVSPLETK